MHISQPQIQTSYRYISLSCHQGSVLVGNNKHAISYVKTLTEVTCNWALLNLNLSLKKTKEYRLNIYRAQ